MCQVHTGAYVSLVAPGKTDYNTACHPRRIPRTRYILHVVPITTHTHARRKSIGKKKQRKYKKITKRKAKKRKESEKGKRKGKGRKDKKSKERQDNKRKQGKQKRKNVILADPRN